MQLQDNYTSKCKEPLLSLGRIKTLDCFLQDGYNKVIINSSSNDEACGLLHRP